MSDHSPGAMPTVSRRSMLLGSAAVGAAAFVGAGSLTASPALAAPSSDPTNWPSARLDAAAGRRVDPTQFISTAQFQAWGQHLDDIGLRATGSDVHETYVRRLAGELSAAGVSDVHLEGAKMKRWLAQNWSLSVAGERLHAASYVPYSGNTSAAGVSGPLVYITAAQLLVPRLLPALTGKIAVYDVPLTPLPMAALRVLQYSNGIYDPKGELPPTGTYLRPWFNRVQDTLAALKAAGAVGSIGILDLNRHWADGQYFPYDGVFREFPSLYVDRGVGATLKRRAARSTRGTIVLQAEVKSVTTHNVVGFIPGMSDELTVLHTHTDGTNGLEENGQYGIIGAAQYLARLPKSSRPRTIMVLLATGHFLNGVGTMGFLARHLTDLVPKMTSVTTVEHLGAREYLPTPDGDVRATGRYEPALYFSTGGRAQVMAANSALRRARVAPAGVARAFLPNPLTKPDSPIYTNPDLAPLRRARKSTVYFPGEGTYMCGAASLPVSNYITGPYYLLNAGMSTVDKIDFARMRAISMALVGQTLELARASRADIAAFT